MLKRNLKNKGPLEWCAAAASVFLGFVLFSPETFQAYPWILKLADFAAVGGLAALGFGGVTVVRRK